MEEGQDVYALLIKRENLRTKFINEQGRAELPPAWTDITRASAKEAHPLTMLAEDKRTKANLEATRFAYTGNLCVKRDSRKDDR